MVPGAKVRVLPVSRRHLSVVPDLPVQLPQRPTQPVPHRLESMDRDEAITKIRTALKGRSDKRWSVRGGTGTAWGWITITAPPSRRGEHGEMTAEDCAELGELFALGHPAHHQGITVAASILYRHEYVARAEGRQPEVLGTQYWD